MLIYNYLRLEIQKGIMFLKLKKLLQMLEKSLKETEHLIILQSRLHVL